MQGSSSAFPIRALVVGVVAGLAASCDGVPSELQLLGRDAAGTAYVTQNPLTETPSLLRAVLDADAIDGLDGTGLDLVADFFDRYGPVFGVDGVGEDLRSVVDRTDRLGMQHVTLQQTFRGVDVYGAEMTVHLNRDADGIVAVTNSAVPDVRVRSVDPRIDADSAVRVAMNYMPGAEVESSDLVVYPGRRRASAARLAWMVQLKDDAAPARRAYAVNARNGRIVDVLDRLYTGRNRKTHSANNEFKLPGTLMRSENDGKVGDKDVDAVHEFAGDTYDYFFETHGRDSFDDLGATISSTAHFRSNFQNAFWDGTQMVYGDGFAVKDVAAHEITHAVTTHSAKLEYRWQSGALNESFSDIFGAMVDRGDWLIGEDLPGGPIRNMEDPTQFNHPGHADDFRRMCNDNEGVHINSGIHNKAYVQVAEGIDRERAERIFYRALTTYLGPQSSFEDARSAALQAATDLFGEGGKEYEAVDRGFAAVGIDGSFDPGPGGCGGTGPESLTGMWTALALILGILGMAVTYWKMRDA